MRRTNSIVLGAACLLVGLVLWDALARFAAEPKLFPWPRYIVQESLPRFASAPQSASPAQGCWALAIECLRTTIRVVVSTAAGIFIGLAAGVLLFIPLRPLWAVELLFRTLRGIPLLCLIPLFVYWFGDSEIPSVYGYIAYAVALIIASDTYATACRLPEGLIGTAKLAGAARINTLIRLVVPAVVHVLSGSLDTVVGLAWAFAVGAELIVLKHGLGHLLRISYLHTDVGRLIILALTYAILGWLSVRLVRALMARLSVVGGLQS